MGAVDLVIYDVWGLDGYFAINFIGVIIGLFGLCIYWIYDSCKAEKEWEERHGKRGWKND